MLIFLCLLSPLFVFGKYPVVDRMYRQGAITGPDGKPSSLPVGINGTDLGIIYQMPTGHEMGFLFGDTFGDVGWISNSMAVLDLNTEDWSRKFEITRWITNSNGLAKELVPGQHVDYQEMTKIPNGAISFPNENTIYMQYMSIKHWGDAGTWETNNSSFAVSKDNGQNWQILNQQFIFAANSKFCQTSLVDGKDGYIYLFGTSAGRVGPVYLARVPDNGGSGSNLVNAAAYQYLSKAGDSPQWGTKESDSVALFRATAGETSVAWNPYVNQWMIMYFDNDLYEIGIRISDNLWGPWSDWAVAVRGIFYPELYGGYIHPTFMQPGLQKDSSTVYFTMSQFALYEVFWCHMDISVL